MGQKKIELSWITPPLESQINGKTITMVAGKSTNLFNSPSGYFKCSDFPFYSTEVVGDFIATCHINPRFDKTYDLGCLIVWENDDKWIKFAYELSDSGYPAIVSIRTDVYSDDCNGPMMEEPCWLRISRKDNVFALHYSKDTKNWALARIFRMEMNECIMVGISAQCPSGEKVSVDFNEFEITDYDFTNQRLGKGHEEGRVHQLLCYL